MKNLNIQPEIPEEARDKLLEHKRDQVLSDLLGTLGTLAAFSTYIDEKNDTIEIAHMMARDIGALSVPPRGVSLIFLLADRVIFHSRYAAEKHQEQTGNEFVAVLGTTNDDAFVEASWSQYFRSQDPRVHLLDQPTCDGNCNLCEAKQRDPAEMLYT